MNVKINFEELVGLANEYMDSCDDYHAYRAKKYGRRGTVCMGFDRDLDWKYESMQKADAALYAACRVTGIPYAAVLNAARIERKYERDHNWEKLLFGFHDDEIGHRREKLLEVLTAKAPGDLTGIYQNEFYPAACEKFYAKKYAEYNAYWYGK